MDFQYLTERELASRLGLSVKTLQGWRLRGQGPPVTKLGPSLRAAVRYEATAALEWARTVGTGDA